MKHIQELLADERIGVISAHPDDHLIHGHAIYAAHTVGATVRELTLATGERSTINHHPDPDFVVNGGRPQEGIAAAHYMGIVSNDHLNGGDGNLANEQEQHTSAITEWIVYHGISLLLTLGGLIDHDDHTASATIARRAAAQLRDNDAYAVGVLEVQHADTGEWQAYAHNESQATIFGAARRHISQMMVAETVQPGWRETPGGFWLHPDTMAGLDQYPIRRSASYIWLPSAMLAETSLPNKPRTLSNTLY
jgi:LmbE family N-acetylglucosaminyl deacetylase